MNKPTSSFKVRVSATGRLKMIYDDRHAPLLGEGEAHITRASHVEPGPDGNWYSDMSPVNGPTLGPFALRQEALDAEVAYLNENVL